MRRNAFLILVMILSSLMCDDMVGDIKGVKNKNDLIILSRLNSEAGEDGIVYPSGVYSHWKMDESSGQDEPNQISAQSIYHISQPVNSVSSDIGKLDDARGTFTDSNYLRVQNDDSTATNKFNSIVQSGMIEFWMKVPTIASTKFIISKYSEPTGWYVYVDSSGNICTYIGGSSTFTSDVNLTDDNWHYLVWANLGTGTSNWRVYVDNVLRGQDDGVSSTGLGSGLDRYKLTIGRRPDQAGWSFPGLIDDIVYWNNPPSTWVEVEEIISKRWNNGNGKRYISAP